VALGPAATVHHRRLNKTKSMLELATRLQRQEPVVRAARRRAAAHGEGGPFGHGAGWRAISAASAARRLVAVRVGEGVGGQGEMVLTAAWS